jgi:hypothetical protein
MGTGGRLASQAITKKLSSQNGERQYQDTTKIISKENKRKTFWN